MVCELFRGSISHKALNSRHGGYRKADCACADVARHLARHGAIATIAVRKSRGKAVGRVLPDHAEKTRADLPVVGGYGRSRFREWAMGGVPRELLLSAPIPVLYSHQAAILRG